MRIRPSILLQCVLILCVCTSRSSAQDDQQGRRLESTFRKHIRPLLNQFCLDCHNPDDLESGINVARLDGKLADRNIRLWLAIRSQLKRGTMPPDDSEQPSTAQKTQWIEWIDAAENFVRTRKRPKNGSIRRLTVAQYQNTLRELLGIDDKLTDVLPPDAVSKDGFLNNQESMVLSPLLLEAFFDIADRALDLCLVNEKQPPTIQHFRVTLGKDVNKKPCPDRLILGANSHLLANSSFVVEEPELQKPFAFNPFRMQTHYRFHEGYQGNSTVRGWREYNSIYHAVFACMRGTGGYPKGQAYEAIPEGLLLRPAIPSAELFQVASTYGPKANFKIALRELPDTGRFRVTVRAAKYNDGLLLERGTADDVIGNATVVASAVENKVNIPRPGIYRIDIYRDEDAAQRATADSSRLNESLAGIWSLDGTADSEPILSASNAVVIPARPATVTDEVQFSKSPFGQGAGFNGKAGSISVPRDDAMNVGSGEFTVAAWIHPSKLQQGGIVSLGGYGYTHGWLLDMPGKDGRLRIETSNGNNQSNGTVQTRPGILRNKQWQHVAAVVRRGAIPTELFVNGYKVAAGEIGGANLDNPTASLLIGRIADANVFHGKIDEVRLYRRALSAAEIAALVEPGQKFAKRPPQEGAKRLDLQLGDRYFSGNLNQPAFLVARLANGPLPIRARYHGNAALNQIAFSQLPNQHPLASDFLAFEQRPPKLGVHIGLRRDCGHTLSQVGLAQSVRETQVTSFRFEDAIANFPNPRVQKENDNYLAGVREIGVRSEFTDGRDTPRLLIHSVDFEGPLYESWPPETHRRIFFDSENKQHPEKYTREILQRFASRAFRRPVTKNELAAFMRVWQTAYDSVGDFQDSIRDALQVVLTSPQMLFLIDESHSPAGEALTDWELASRLSYFLWNSPPDARLLKLAAGGSLRHSLHGEVERMIVAPDFDLFAREFVAQWLGTAKLAVVETDRKKFPQLTRDIKAQLQREPQEFVKHVIRHNRPLRDLIDSDYVVINEVIAPYYGLTNQTNRGFDFQAVRHNKPELGGLLTQAGLLAALSDGRESNPIKRGAWFARKIIAEPPADPPPNVPDLEEDTSHLPLRERLEKHRNQPGCRNCHAGIDPWGLPFEEFSAGGLFHRKPSESVASALPDGTTVQGVNGLKRYLVEQRMDQVTFSFLKHVAVYAVGRSLSYNEIEFLRKSAVELTEEERGARDLIRFIVNSPIFLEK